MLVEGDAMFIEGAESLKCSLNDTHPKNMRARLTRNGYSIQAVIPAELCEKYGFSPGQSIVMDERDDGVLMRRNPLERPSPIAWTIGYEGMSLDSFVSKLKSNKVEQVVDVRELPLSRKPGFSRSTLESSLRKAGLLYFHMRELGTPKALRDDLRNGGSAPVFFEKYRIHLERNWRSLDLLRGLATIRLTAIMCYERRFEDCHRKVIAERLESDGVRVMHL
ncbi:MAG: DUF488 family protein [Candidatus Thermoplasmatota archaeon]|nr:DUF488 family protein [Candidatus Thermoplasmatota archaeon]